MVLAERARDCARAAIDAYVIRPRRRLPSSWNFHATWASNPMPARLTNNRSFISPTSISLGSALIACRMASAGFRLIPSWRARPLPEPAGTIPSGTSPNVRADATSLIVPSPPHAMTSRAPRATAAFVSSRACPWLSVTKTSAGSPCRSTMADASSARARAASGRTPPAMGLITKAMEDRRDALL